MQIRILHEPWEFEAPYEVQAANMVTPDARGEPQPLWFHLRRFSGEADARRFLEAYAKGAQVVCEWPISESADPPHSPGASADLKAT